MVPLKKGDKKKGEIKLILEPVYDPDKMLKNKKKKKVVDTWRWVK